MPRSIRRTPRQRLARLLAAAAGRVDGGGAFTLLPRDRVHIELEQPPHVDPHPRWGHGRPSHPTLDALISARASHYIRWLETLERFGAGLAAIDRGPRSDSEPSWNNPMTTGLDAASIYCNLRERNPARYLEIGSGHSTKFARRAISDGALRTEIVSIDPEPRTEIDAICDNVIRSRLEQADLAVFDGLAPGDVVFYDGSHRVFMNNDVTVFFLEVLPRIPEGVLVGIHDICLPDDYFPEQVEMYWTEQYLLAAALLFAPERFQISLPCHYIAVRPDLARALGERWEAAGLAGLNAYGSAIWFELTR